jgi:hypothetical protein
MVRRSSVLGLGSTGVTARMPVLHVLLQLALMLESTRCAMQPAVIVKWWAHTGLRARFCAHSCTLCVHMHPCMETAPCAWQHHIRGCGTQHTKNCNNMQHFLPAPDTLPPPPIPPLARLSPARSRLCRFQCSSAALTHTHAPW